MGIMAKNLKDHAQNLPPYNAYALCLGLSSSGHLHLYNEDNEEEGQERISDPVPGDKIRSFFEKNDAVGLLRLGLTHFSEPLSSSLSFWRAFAQIFIAEVCKQTASFEQSTPEFQIVLPSPDINELLNEAPFMHGLKFLNQEMMALIWQRLIGALKEELAFFGGQIDAYFAAYQTAWNTLGRVSFHLAENKSNPTHPFAFLATYTSRLSKSSEPQHLPLGRALEEFAEKSKKSLLLALLVPVQRAIEKSTFLKELVDNGKIFQPLAWKATDAYQFLKDIPHFEASGIKVRVPNWWNAKKPPRPSINVSIGNETTSAVGLGALLDFNVQFALPSGDKLTPEEFKSLLSTQEQLIQIRGQWVQVDNDKLNLVLLHWKKIERQVKKEGLSFAEGLRLLSGIPQGQTETISHQEISTWSTIEEGDYLRSVLSSLRQPELKGETALKSILKKYLKAELRPYQARGVQWLWWLYNLRLGGCLADDMGLGKTIQVLSLLLLIKYQEEKHQAETTNQSSSHLLILPASLLDNWKTEINRFAPTLTVWVAHSSGFGVVDLHKAPDLSSTDLVITTYGTMHRLPWLSEKKWNIVILDEAQAIKNPMTKQTLSVKQLNNQVRFVLTGTPIENRLLDLWSLFDFVAPGLLGKAKEFANYGKQKGKTDMDKSHFFASVRRLVTPYILRRLKSDKSIISDLPDKTEIQTYCSLSKQQIGLYQQAVNELTAKLEQQKEGIQRSGLVLSYLMRFKQICNHPNQWLGHGQYDANLSGKFIRLKELCEPIIESEEKILVFTQFREIIPALSDFLAKLFGREGLSLHGQTTVKERAKRVQAFQQEDGPPFFVLSLKAGGTGLNLTAASHVIHFDRWWNPAVENQATDRAYRIGQKKNVLVHKFICSGTIEEKIDTLINSKKNISQEIIGEAEEIILTKLSDTELLNIVSLDIHRALEER